MPHIHYIGHATVVIDIGRLRVLTDPFLRDRLLFLHRHGPNPAPALLETRAPDLVLLSHLHHDHVDLPSLRQLPRQTLLVAPRGSGHYLTRATGLDVYELVAGQSFSMADVEVTALPADHPRQPAFVRPAASCLGYVLRNGMSVYFAGDTGLFAGMSDVGASFDLDLALLPIWGYGPQVGSGHLTPLTAAQALTMLHPRVVVPIHWGALRYAGPHMLWTAADYLYTPPQAFAGHAARLAPATEVRVLQPGQNTIL